MHSARPFLIVCPDCGDQALEARNPRACPVCAGESWVPRGHHLRAVKTEDEAEAVTYTTTNENGGADGDESQDP